MGDVVTVFLPPAYALTGRRTFIDFGLDSWPLCARSRWLPRPWQVRRYVRGGPAYRPRLAHVGVVLGVLMNTAG